ncbi:MAG: hypothetical protein GX988_01125 [Clostridiales bacterium]|nr:hypothetical protein [Clostridiales bacterium]
MNKIAALLCAVLMIYVFGGLLDNAVFAEESSDPSEDDTITNESDSSNDTSSDSSTDASSDSSNDTSSDSSNDTSSDGSTDASSDSSNDTSSDGSNDTSSDDSNDTSSDSTDEPEPEEPTTTEETTTTTKKTKKKKTTTVKTTTTTTTEEATTTTAETEQTTEVEEVESVIITKDALIAAAESGEDVKVSGFTEDGFEYQWLIKGTDLTGELTDIDLTVYNTSDYEDRMRAFVPRHIGLAAISFAENGELPAKAQLTIDTGGVLATGKAYLYTYNRATGRAELVEEVKFADDRVEITLQERMDYFFTDRLLDEQSKEMSGAVKLTVMTVIGLLVAGIFGLVVSKVRDIQVYRRELIDDTRADGAYTIDDTDTDEDANEDSTEED